MTNASATPAATGTYRTAVISGASTGIGRATALALADAGWWVYAGVRDLSAAPSSRSRGSIVPIHLDVTDPDSINAAIMSITADQGGRPVDVLISNAGVGQLAPMQTVPLAELRAVLDVNLVGAVALTQAVLPLMTTGSRLVFLGSVGDRITMPFGGPLTSSKWAIASIAEAFRLELAAIGIDVVLIEPGSINTPAVDKVETAAAHTIEVLKQSNPELATRFATAAKIAVTNERRGSSPDEVARTILHAVTINRPRTRYLTGHHAHLLAALGILPDRVFDRLRLRLFHQPTQQEKR